MCVQITYIQIKTFCNIQHCQNNCRFYRQYLWAHCYEALKCLKNVTFKGVTPVNHSNKNLSVILMLQIKNLLLWSKDLKDTVFLIELYLIEVIWIYSCECTWQIPETKHNIPTLCLFLVHGIISFMSFLKFKSKNKKWMRFIKQNSTYNKRKISFNLCFSKLLTFHRHINFICMPGVWWWEQSEGMQESENWKCHPYDFWCCSSSEHTGVLSSERSYIYHTGKTKILMD